MIPNPGRITPILLGMQSAPPQACHLVHELCIGFIGVANPKPWSEFSVGRDLGESSVSTMQSHGVTESKGAFIDIEKQMLNYRARIAMY